MRLCLAICFVWIISAHLTSCKKSTLKSVNNTGSIDSLSYQPNQAGSTWKFDIYLQGIKNGTKTIVCQSYDSTINNKVYDVMMNNDGSLDFTRRDQDKYYTVLTASTNKTELCVLDVSKSNNQEWIGGVNGTDTYYYTIVERQSSQVINGITLKNTIKVFNQRKNASGNVTLSGYAYYAQGIGNYKNEGTLANIPVEFILTSADIK